MKIYRGILRQAQDNDTDVNQFLYRRFVKRWEQVVDLPPQTLGPLTPVYKILVKRLKVMPWVAFGLCATICVVVLYLVFGSAITILTSVLQNGF